MLPTLNLTGSLVLVERLSIRFGKMASGEVVLIRSPEEPRKVVIKRIVGVEGDAVGNEEATAVVNIIALICFYCLYGFLFFFPGFYGSVLDVW